MAREFCRSNVARLVLGIVIVLGVLLGIGVWMFYSPGHGTSIVHPTPGDAK